jgi:hypothetical protein
MHGFCLSVLKDKTLVLPCSWPRSGDGASVEIDYAEKGDAIGPVGSSFEECNFFETPKGFSGGGVWVLPKTAEGELFQPRKHVKLCGTQFQWDEDRRILQAMRPRFTLPYFFEWYPDLRADYGHILDG